jgi:hypothetical protein|tara:strand:- start:17 stop:616 length:600 start_codon:yes stop_codon:yes gene_type:complete
MDENTKLEMSKIVKQLMDEEGFEFGEAVKEAMRRMEKTKKANGGIMRKMLRAGDDPRDFEDEVDVQETDVDVIELMKDQGIPMGEQVKSKKEGIMQMAGETPEEERDMEFNIELKEFLNENPGATVDDFIKIKMLEAKLRREARDEILARITLARGGGELVGNQSKIDVAAPFGEITGADFAKLREDKQSGGIAGILGV